MTNLEIVTGSYKGFLEGNLDMLFSNLDDEVIWKNHGSSDTPLPVVSKGIEGVMKYFEAVDQKLDIRKFDIQHIMQNEDLFTVLIDVNRTVKKSGVEKNGQYVHVIRFRDGKLKEMDLYEPEA